jgi:hypothetical protein
MIWFMSNFLGSLHADDLRARQSAPQSIYDGSAWPKVWGPEKLEATIKEVYQK